ncbi:gamma-glutamylcyclotransferase [Clostridia bacterium]|nr:gamma-glutamylcyclotransferase [Clostridia bacterium]
MTIYAAYGANTHKRKMSERCPTAEIIGKSELKDYRLLFRGEHKFRCHATVEPHDGFCVPLLIWRITSADEDALDRCEGFPDYYHKEFVDIFVNGESLNVMLYVMNDGYCVGIPSEQYYKTVRAGFDLEVL